MTESEAIEELKYDCNELGKAIPCDTSWGCSFENAYEMAIQALEKQIPMKPKERDCIGFDTLACPECKMALYLYEPYCDNCGQAIDWSDDNDD